MKINHKQLSFETMGNKATYFEIREQCREFVKECGIQNGILVVQSPHTTCAVFFEEYVHDENPIGHDYLQMDLNKGLRKIFPDETEFNGY